MLAVGVNKDVHPQTHWQIGTGIQGHEHVENLRVDLLRWVVGVHCLLAHAPGNAGYRSGELAPGVGVRRRVGVLSDLMRPISVSSISVRTRSVRVSPMTMTMLGNVADTCSPACRSNRRTVPSIGTRI
jgi:hypothetical protein